MYNDEEFSNLNYGETNQPTNQPTNQSTNEPEYTIHAEEVNQYQQPMQTEYLGQTYENIVQGVPVQDKKAEKRAAKAAKKAAKIQKKTDKKLAGGNGRKPKLAFRIVAYSVSAILLGGLAGGACYGVSYAGFTIFPLDSGVTTTNANTTAATQVSSTISDDNISVTVSDVSDMVSKVISSVVAINGTYTESVDNGFFGSQTYESTVSGSGIIIGTNDDELLIVTNAHVVEDVDDLAVTLYDGSEVDAVIKGMQTSYDLAVLAVKLSDIPDDAVYSIATLADTDDVQVGDAAIAVGNSMGYGISVTTGVISALDRTVTVDDVDYNNLIQTDAAINPGNSGGALFNANGEVIGINSVKMSDTGVEGMGYAISITSVNDIIDQLSLEETKEQLSDDERGYLGITGISITDDISTQYGYPVGVLVRTVTEDSAADNAGLIKNDIITSFDGQEVKTIDELVDLMSYYAVGDKVEVVYYHMNDSGEYEKATTTVTLTEKPE